MKISWWCDSGANIHSCRKGTVTLEELNITKQEWNSLSDDEKDDIMQTVALERLDWGYREEE